MTPSSVAHRTTLLQNTPPGELLIHEIYRSIQGESTFAGLPCVFVRTAVCDLRCSWCDTPHAFNRGERMTREDVRSRAISFGIDLIEITGGEPLLQSETLPLMSELCDAGKTVLLETSGAHDIALVDPRVRIIMDLKCPDSGESARNLWTNLDKLKPSDEVKFVIASKADFDWTVETVRSRDLTDRFEVLVGGAFGDVTPRDLAEWILASGVKVRMQLQLHKFIWPPDERGV